MIVNNLSDYAKNHKYIVARETEYTENGSNLWFWGAWDSLAEATQAANEIGGIVIEREDVETVAFVEPIGNLYEPIDEPNPLKKAALDYIEKNSADGDGRSCTTISLDMDFDLLAAIVKEKGRMKRGR